MKVLFITIGDNQVPSSRVRALQYIPNFEKEGISCDHIQYRKGFYLKYQTYGVRTNFMAWLFTKALSVFFKLYDYLIYSKISLFRIGISYANYDLVFIQKVVLPSILVKRIKEKCKIIFDFDDAIYTKSRLFTLRQFRYQINRSDITIVTNEEARQYVKGAGGERIETIIGPIDSDRYQSAGNQVSNKQFNIGWIGSQTNFHYLDIIKEPLKEFCDKHPGKVYLHLVGVDKVLVEEVDTVTYKWDPETEVQILDGIDVGVMPLKDDEFTRGKGGYKLLQYMSMGKANISSPVGVNTSIVQNDQTGLLANTAKEWVNCFELYFNDATLRKTHGEHARNAILNNYALKRWSAFLIDFVKSLESEDRQ